MSNTATVSNGTVENTSITSTKVSSKGTTALGKDAFLQLLVAQMQYQDPLEPSSDTEWISQLATFSSLEEMQNMSSTLNNTQAFSMIGKTVSIDTGSEKIEGVVEYVSVTGNTPYVSVNGNKYKASDVTAVLSEEYLKSVYGPKVKEATVTYNYDDPSDIKLAVSLGQDSYAATGMFVAINGTLLDSSNMEYDEKNGILTIKKEAFEGLETANTYDIGFIFDDSSETTITGKVTLKVVGSQPKSTEPESAKEDPAGEASKDDGSKDTTQE